MSQFYRVKSTETGQWISGDAVPDAPVATTPFPTASIKFRTDIPTTVEGLIDGLYINPGEMYPPRLVWSERKYYWRVIRTPTGYQFIPADGRDAYWAQKFSTIPFIAVLRGSEVTAKENDFQIVAIEI